MNVPYNTGKVRIGLLHKDKRYDPMSPDMQRIQTLLLASGEFKTEGDMRWPPRVVTKPPTLFERVIGWFR